MRVVCHEASAHFFCFSTVFDPPEMAKNHAWNRKKTKKHRVFRGHFAAAKPHSCALRKGMPWWGYLLYLPLLLRAKWIEAQILLALNEDLKSIFRSPGFWLGMLEHADWFTDGSLVELISKLPVFFCKKKRHIFDFRVLVCFLKWW